MLQAICVISGILKIGHTCSLLLSVFIDVTHWVYSHCKYGFFIQCITVAVIVGLELNMYHTLPEN